MSDENAAVDAWRRDPTPLRLACGVQHYEWGERGRDAFIPRLVGASGRDGADAEQSHAELWMGAHPMLPAMVALGDARLSLLRLIEQAPDETLGAHAVRRFGPELPFLAKVLTAARPLSIQAHPDRAQAAAGYAREDAAGIPRDAPGRNYRDRNHKPELILALGDFYALEGFRPAKEIAAAFAAVPELAPLLAGAPPPQAAAADRDWLRKLFERCMSPADAEAERALAALVARLDREATPAAAGAAAAPAPASAPARDRAEYWLVSTARRLPRTPGPDRGLFAFYLLNLVHLRAGEALFLTAGEPHAYLEGRGLEVMANSDNVLRGGLTPKHVDLAELLRVLTFDAAPARPLLPDADGRYAAAVDEFAARMIELAPDSAPSELEGGAATILLAVDGAAELEAGAHRLLLARGEACFIPAAIADPRLRPGAPGARIFAVTVPA